MAVFAVLRLGVLVASGFLQDEAPASRPGAPAASIVFLEASFEDVKGAPPAAPMRRVSIASAEAAKSSGKRAKSWGEIVATHEVRAARALPASADREEIEAAAVEPFAVGKGATFERAGEPAVQGFVRTAMLGADHAMLMATVPDGAESTLRVFALAPRKGRPGEAPERLASLRLASAYPAPSEGGQLDAFVVENAQVASEAPFTDQGVSIAGAGDRPRRFMRGHRFEAGRQRVASVRYVDPNGGSLRVSVSWAPGRPGPRLATSADVAVAVTEIAPDLETGRTLDGVSGAVDLIPIASGGARLRLSLDARLRLVGGRDPQRCWIVGDFDCVPLALDALTPWLGKFHKGRPVLETFAVPGEPDR